MARTNHNLVSFLRYAVLGAIGGSALIAIVGTLSITLAPKRYDAGIVLFHLPGSGMSDSARDFVAASLARPEFLARVVAERGSDNPMAERLIDKLFVEATNAAGSVAELHLIGSDAAKLATILKGVAREMVALHSDKQKAKFRPLLDKLDEELKTAVERRRKFKAALRDFGPLPSSARGAVVVSTDLARKRLELELQERYRVRQSSVSQDMKRRRQLKTLIGIQEERRQKPVKGIDFESPHFKLVSNVTFSDVEVLVLKQTKGRLDTELELRKPLIIERDVVVTPIVPNYMPLVLLTAVGGLIGALVAGLVWSYRQSSAGVSSASVVGKYLNLPVVGVTAQWVSDFGERERQVLADSDTQDLAVAGIHSVRVALHLLARAEPVIFAEIGNRRHASHIIANLAIVAAQAGERVLIIDVDSSQNVLAGLLARKTNSEQVIAPNANETTEKPEIDKHALTPTIRLLGGDDVPNNVDAKTLPVAREFLADFDRILIYAGTVSTAKDLLKGYDTGIGIVVCPSDVRLSALRKAYVRNMHGVLLCACPID
ncbi:MAG: hypothetical protein ACI9BW_004443, partial [Gammaproteobacteria bacterium]